MRKRLGVIDQFAFPQHGSGQGSDDIGSPAFKVRFPPRDNIDWNPQAAKCRIHVSYSKVGAWRVIRQYHEKIDVNVRSDITSRSGSKEIDLERMIVVH
jgi:hypothetical protein